MDEKIVIIGAGVNGITTAVVLQFLGHSTKIYAESLPDDLNTQSQPAFASLYPSASVIPHSVYSSQLENLFNDSQYVFLGLKKQSFPGLSIHKHFEIFEFEKEQPEYLEWMMNLRFIDDLDSNKVPRLNNDTKLYGWCFDCLFADWPIYFPALIERYKKSGGEIVTQKLESEDIAELPASIIINCSGLGSISLFDDRDEQLVMRGHLLHKESAPLIKNSRDEVISYNYTPTASVYADLTGRPCDVYCYPRRDGWLLGGSRQAGTISASGQWKGKKVKSSSRQIDGISFPSQIIDLNRQIIEHSFGLSFSDVENLSTAMGYRYIRSESNGLRLEKENSHDKEIYHNYGHGGAGVTLSWGCALKIAAEIDHADKEELKEKLRTL